MQIEPGPKSYERYEYVEPTDAAQAKQSATPVRNAFTVDRVVKFVIAVIFLLAAGALLWYFSRLVLYLMAGLIIAYLLRPVVDRIQGFGVSRVPAILLSFILVFGVMSVLVTSLIPFFGSQISDVTQQITEEKVDAWAVSIESQLRQRIPAIGEGTVIEGVRRVSSTLFQEQQFTQLVESLFDVFTDIFYAILVIPFVAFFFLRDATKMSRGILQLVPNRYFEVTLSIAAKIETNLGRYLRGLLLQCTYVAIVASILLSFTDLNYALVVGIFTGVANSIPYFGPFMGLIAGSLVAIAQTGDFSLIPGLLIAMGLTQMVDNILIQPFIFSKAAQTHPLVILFVVLIGAQLAGIVGMLIAIPLTTTVLVTIEQVLWSLRNYRILHVA
ncbi:MAG: AI-2E family transporter [Bacteroidota bacterium]